MATHPFSSVVESKTMDMYVPKYLNLSGNEQ